MQSHLSKFAHTNQPLEDKVTLMIKNKCRTAAETSPDSNVWKKLSVEL